MNCDDFRKLFPYFMEQLSRGQELDEDLEADWSDHLNACKECFTWFASEQLKLRGFDPASFPCPHIGFHATHECDEHDGPFDCPHQVIVNVDGEWGIPIKDDTASMVRIDNCPWCGTALGQGWPKSSEVEKDENGDAPPKHMLN